MDKTVQELSLKDRLRKRMAEMAVTAVRKLSAGPFGTGESRKDYEKRIMHDESAWTNMNHKAQGILP